MAYFEDVPLGAGFEHVWDTTYVDSNMFPPAETFLQGSQWLSAAPWFLPNHLAYPQEQHLEQPKVRRPMNAFMCWSKQKRRELAAKNPKMHNADLSKILGREWKSMKHAEKQPYIDMAEQIRVQHMRDHPDYKYKPKRKKKKQGGDELTKILQMQRIAQAEDSLRADAEQRAQDAASPVVQAAPVVYAPVVNVATVGCEQIGSPPRTFVQPCATQACYFTCSAEPVYADVQVNQSATLPVYSTEESQSVLTRGYSAVEISQSACAPIYVPTDISQSAPELYARSPIMVAQVATHEAMPIDGDIEMSSSLVECVLPTRDHVDSSPSGADDGFHVRRIFMPSTQADASHSDDGLHEYDPDLPDLSPLENPFEPYFCDSSEELPSPDMDTQFYFDGPVLSEIRDIDKNELNQYLAPPGPTLMSL